MEGTMFEPSHNEDLLDVIVVGNRVHKLRTPDMDVLP